MMEDMGFNDAMEQVTADEAKFAVNCRCGSSSIRPSIGVIVGKCRIGMLQECNCNYEQSVLRTVTPLKDFKAYQASG
jgi:hypothetical protein